MEKIFVLVAALLGVTAQGALAAPLGKVDSVFSLKKVFTVTVHRGDADLQLDAGKPLQEGDIVRTTDSQGASVELARGSVVVLGSSAEAVLTSPTTFELKSGSAFVHVGTGFRAPNYFVVNVLRRYLGTERGDFELRAEPTLVTVYTISAALAVALSPDQLKAGRLTLTIDEAYFAKLGLGGTAPDTYPRESLFAFEGADEVFGQHVRRLRAARYPLPVADHTTEGGSAMAGSVGTGANPGSTGPFGGGGAGGGAVGAIVGGGSVGGGVSSGGGVSAASMPAPSTGGGGGAVSGGGSAPASGGGGGGGSHGW